MNTFLFKINIFATLLFFLHPAKADTEATDGYIEFLKKNVGNVPYSSIDDDFRERLNLDLDGIMIQRLLEEPDLVGFLYANQDAAPEKHQLMIISEMLLYEKHWNMLMGSQPPGRPVSHIISRILAVKGDEFHHLYIALGSEQHRKTIYAILRDLSDAIERTPDRADELKSSAVEKIFQVIYTPTHYSDYRTAEIMRQNTPPHWRPAEDRDEARGEHPPKRGVTQAEEETGASAGTPPWLWAGLITVVVALAGFAIFRLPVKANR